DNPDWVDITLHSYRVRWGGAPRDPQYEALEAALAAQPPIRVPTTVLTGSRDGATLPEATAGQERRFTGRYARRVLSDVGHFPTREQPQAVVEAALELQR
ncbi:MAG: alpha/beta hydrolase, partial [Acetobacteraceae bacterium]|nr:alpha/beta hydrolase [Acetobacteraceae bacterium]